MRAASRATATGPGVSRIDGCAGELARVRGEAELGERDIAVPVDHVLPRRHAHMRGAETPLVMLTVWGS
jgi:hypothetical protein